MEKKTTISEDWLSLCLGLFVFVLSLGLFFGLDLLGWGVKTNVWMNISESISSISKNYEGMAGLVPLLLTCLFLLFIVCAGLKLISVKLQDLLIPFTIIFFISYLCWLAGHYGFVAANSDKLEQCNQ